MSKILFENEFFKSEMLDSGETVITILKDNDKFFGVDITNSKLITNREGFITDEFTNFALESIKEYANENGLSAYKLQYEIRNRTLNRIISML